MTTIPNVRTLFPDRLSAYAPVRIHDLAPFRNLQDLLRIVCTQRARHEEFILREPRGLSHTPRSVKRDRWRLWLPSLKKQPEMFQLHKAPIPLLDP